MASDRGTRADCLSARVAYSHVSDIPPNQVCLAWDATRRSRLIQDFAAIAADHPPVASRTEPGRPSPSGP